MEHNVYRHPEWKRLYDELTPGLESGAFFDYETLEEKAGVDIRTHRGRKQFHRFAKEVLHAMDLCFQVVRKQGYRVIEPREHGNHARRKSLSAGRKMYAACDVMLHTPIQKLDISEAKAHTDLSIKMGRQLQMFRDDEPAIDRLADQMEYRRLPSPGDGFKKKD